MSFLSTHTRNVWSMWEILCQWYDTLVCHDDVIKWKHFLCYWSFVRGIHRSLVNSPHKGQWRGALVFSLICAWINGWVNNGKAGDLGRHRTHYDVTVMPKRNTLVLVFDLPDFHFCTLYLICIIVETASPRMNLRILIESIIRFDSLSSVIVRYL